MPFTIWFITLISSFKHLVTAMCDNVSLFANYFIIEVVIFLQTCVKSSQKSTSDQCPFTRKKSTYVICPIFHFPLSYFIKGNILDHKVERSTGQFLILRLLLSSLIKCKYIISQSQKLPPRWIIIESVFLIFERYLVVGG